MVDLRQPSATLRGQQRDPAAADDAADNGGHAARRGNGVEPVVVGGSVAGAVSVLVEPRILTEADIPWLFHLCRKKYANSYDAIATEIWFRNTVLKNALIYLPQRTENAFCISNMYTMPWTSNEFEACVLFLCADDGAGWEALKLLRASVEWAKFRRCVAWRCASETDSDLTAFARRVGATELSPRFTIRL